MSSRDIHHPRILFFHPNEQVSIEVQSRAGNVSTKLKVYRGKRLAKTSSKKVVVRLPRESLKLSVVELDVRFAGKWDKLHRQRGSVDVVFQDSAGFVRKQRIVPGPAVSRWTYRLFTMNPNMAVGVCTERNCKNRMIPAPFVSCARPCKTCGEKKMISIPMWTPKSAAG